MLNRSPMARGTGFKRLIPQPPARPERMTVWPVAQAIRAQAAIKIIANVCRTQPKEAVLHSSTYQALVRKLPCARCGILGYSQFCHADEGKGMGIKTDDRRGWPGCGPHHGTPGCHWIVGTSGQLKRDERRAAEAQYAEQTRAEIMRRKQWPAKLPFYAPKQIAAQ